MGAVQYGISMGTTSIFGSIASGEGIMCTFTGPGPVWVQSHKPKNVQSGGAKQVQVGGAKPLICFCCFFCFILMFMLLVVYLIIFGDDAPAGRTQGGKGR